MVEEIYGEVGPGPGDGSRAVAVGGGHGLSRCLRALTHAVDHVTAVVTTADDGGSSGRLRRSLGVVPPGDMRMALAALSPRRDLARLVQYRFPDGELEGHSLGNLIIVATTDLNGGDIVAALDYVASVVDARGRVLPCTRSPVALHARTAAGGELHGQATIAGTRDLETVWIEPSEPEVTEDVVVAIQRADLIALGPGSLYTSIIPNLLVPGVAEALRSTNSPIVLVANLREQLGETEGLTMVEQVEILMRYASGIELSAIIAHRGPEPAGEGRPLVADEEQLSTFAPRVLLGDLVDPREGHDPGRLAVPLGRVLRPSGAALG